MNLNTNNPYESPRAEPPSPGSLGIAAGKKQSRLFLIALPTLAGAVLGSIVLASAARGPGDPSGHSIGAGLGGFAGIGVGVFIRAIVPRLGFLRDAQQGQRAEGMSSEEQQGRWRAQRGSRPQDGEAS